MSIAAALISPLLVHGTSTLVHDRNHRFNADTRTITGAYGSRQEWKLPERPGNELIIPVGRTDRGIPLTIGYTGGTSIIYVGYVNQDHSISDQSSGIHSTSDADLKRVEFVNTFEHYTGARVRGDVSARTPIRTQTGVT